MIDLMFIRTNTRKIMQDGKPVGEMVHAQGQWNASVAGKVITGLTVKHVKKQLIEELES